MINRLLALIVRESLWLPMSMGLAVLSTSILVYRHAPANLSARQRVTAAMNYFFGVTIGIMAVGHFSAVTTRLALGTLNRSAPVLYAIGLLFAVPSWWLALHARRRLLSHSDPGPTTLALNAWLALTLLALGRQNLPLVAPAVLNIAYQLHSRRGVGWATVGIAVILQVALFVASLVFLASGQTFEQFSGGP